MARPRLVGADGKLPETNIAKLERDLMEWAVWYDSNKDNDRGVMEEMKFTQRAIDGAMSCMVRCVVELKAIQNAEKDAYAALLRPELFTGTKKVQ